jgi:hypothetical protein
MGLVPTCANFGQIRPKQNYAKLALFFIEESLLDDRCAPICFEMALALLCAIVKGFTIFDP